MNRRPRRQRTATSMREIEDKLQRQAMLEAADKLRASMSAAIAAAADLQQHIEQCNAVATRARQHFTSRRGAR